MVYNHPAIALPVARYTTVEVRPSRGALTIEHDLWSAREERRTEEALACLFPDGGVHVTIESELPIGVGLGSSAALAVAACRAAGLQGQELLDKALQIENVFHGDASGLDVAVAAREEALWFVRGKPFKSIPAPPCAVLVLDSGEAGNTAAQVEAVASRRAAVEDTLEDIGALVHAARAVLEDPVSLGELLTENHGHLKKLGVSNPTLDRLVDMALACGAHGAKLSGAGGGGIVIALVDDPQPLMRAVRAAGFEAWVARPAP